MTPARLEVPHALRAWSLAFAVLGLAALLWGLLWEPERAWVDLLANGIFFVSLALAGLVFVAIHYLAGAGWWVAVRRLPEALTGALPLMGLPLLALWFGRQHLYPWSLPDAAHDPLIAAKGSWLSAPFFFARMAVLLALWNVFARLLRRASLAQDRGDGVAWHRRLVRLSALFLPVFAVTWSVASFDWLMSLDPRWASTMFAVYTFAGLFLSGIAAVTLGVALLSGPGGPLARAVGDRHRADLGRLLFGFSTFWAYIWVSQYLLVWYANLPEEVTFYVERTHGAWAFLFYLAPVLSWVVPFLALMSRAAKRDPRVLRWVAAIVLVGRWLDVYVLAAPAVLSEPHLGPLELLITLGYAGLFCFAATALFARASLLPANDPYLHESLGRA